MVRFERFPLDLPWWLVILAAALVYAAGQRWPLVAGVAVALLAISVFGMWENTMQTMPSLVYLIPVVMLASVACPAALRS